MPRGRVGVHLSERFVALARRAGTVGEPVIDLVDVRPCAGASQWGAVLGRIVREHRLGRCAAMVVLDPSAYQLSQIEAPDVPAAEVRSAVRWRLKEFVTFRIEDAVVDAFDVPFASGRGARAMLAAAASADGVEPVVEAVVGAGLSIAAIDIPELALRNLAAEVPDQAGGVAIVALGDTSGRITISQGESLYLARSLDFGGEQLSANPDGYADHLVLELQRSLDYYESQLAARPASRVLVAPFPGDRDALIERMNGQMGVVSFGLDLNQVVDCDADVSLEHQASALLAVGAALRTEDAARQQIDLYQDPFRPRRVVLATARLAQLALAFVGLLVLVTLALSWQERRQAAGLHELRQVLATQQEELARLEASLPAPQEDPRLRELLAKLERELAAKQSFLTRFDSHSLGEVRGFSMFMRGLARRPLPDLWLRRIELSGDGGLAFEGSAKHSDAVPAFVRMLTDEPAFQGREFRALRISEQDGRVDFDLRSGERKQ